MLQRKDQTHKQGQPVAVISEGLKKSKQGIFERTKDLTQENNAVYNGHNIH